jgi:hypothetical protein
MILWWWWRLLAFLIARYELIPKPLDAGGGPYLSRWHFPAWLARAYDCAELFLHDFHCSDPDRGWHNHPYTWCESRLLDGAYTQETLWIDVNEYGPPSIHRLCYRVAYDTFRAGETNRLTSQFHAVRLMTRKVRTLFRAGPKHGRSWGFKNLSGEFTPANPAKGAMH